MFSSSKCFYLKSDCYCTGRRQLHQNMNVMYFERTTQPAFQRLPEDHQHFIKLRKEVYRCVQELPAQRLAIARVRAIALVALYFFLYAGALFQGGKIWLFYTLYTLMGITAVLIFLNVIHETCHGNLFQSAFWNRAFYRVFDLLGMNSYIWQQRHNVLHHNYPNVAGWDSDIEQSGPIKIYPHHEPTAVQQYQHILFLVLYPLFLLNWVVLRDFKDYLIKKRIVRKICSIPSLEWLRLLFFKAFFVFYTVVVPCCFFGFTIGQSVTGVLLMLCCAGAFALAVLLTPHVNTGNAYPLVSPEGELKTSWFRHQLLSTNDLSTDNFFTRHIMGNFNYHVAHHLFPNISSVYAPEVTAVIRRYTEAHRLPYRAYSFWEALKKHYELLKNNATTSYGQ